jgi:spore coat protein U domain-containing protein, fimbrial subunit CupE1/2/3/6
MRSLAFLLAFWVGDALALCTASVVPVAFGTYNPLTGQNVDSTGGVDVVCLPPAPYTISISPGQGSYAARLMTSGTYHLAYNLYTSASRSVVWGDGTGGSSSVGGSGATASYPIYGRIPASQNVGIGAYADALLVTVTF